MWKDIVDYEGIYQVNEIGLVKNVNTGHVLKPWKTRFGYLAVKLSKHNKAKEHKVHRLVALAFIPNPHNKPQVNHIDCNRTNNNVNNLEWVTNKENSEWSIKLGRRVITPQWRNNIIKSRAKIVKPVKGIDVATGEVVTFGSLKETSKIGVDPSEVSKCCKGRRKAVGGYMWRYLTAEGAEE